MLWFREIMGWLMVLVAMYVLRMSFLFITDLESPRVIEAAVLVIAGLGILKAGLVLIRIATAGRICGQS
ncbi:MAG: hypothetical protein IT423_22010 [Pirellulaceae bacterium]|nr:hypothetical protein [Pirellulaceae bacterium]